MNRNATPYSQLKIFHHKELLEKLENAQRCNPLYIRIKPTNVCNHNCYYCHYKNPYLTLDEYNPKDMIPHEKMMEIISDMKKMGVKAVTFSGGGEPLVYPYIEEAMEQILAAGIDLSSCKRKVGQNLNRFHQCCKLCKDPGNRRGRFA